MSNNEPSNLTRLLLLLADRASAVEMQQLQVRMREDEVLKAQYDKLIQVTTQPISIEQLSLHFNQVDPELIAAFIDGGLSSQEQVLFERQCWNSDSLLREVATAWRFEVEAGSADRSRNGSVAAIDPAFSGVTASGPKDSTTAAVLPVAGAVPEIDNNPFRPRAPVRHQHRFEQRVWFALASAVVVAGILFGAWKSLTIKEQVPGTPDENQVVEQNSDSTSSDLEHVVQDTELRGVVPDLQRLPDGKPDSELPRMRQPDDVIVDVPDANQSELNPGPTIPPKPDILQPSPKEVSNVAGWLAWSKVDGVAATKNASNSKWRGIESPSNYFEGKAIPWVQVATCEASRLQGDAKDGSRWTADANTSFRISQRRASPPDVVVCELLLGKIAIQNLVEGQILYLRINNETFKLKVDKSDTTFVVYRNAKETVLGVFGGAVSAGTEVINRQAWKKVGKTGNVATWRPESYDAWYNVPIRKQKSLETLHNKLNGAPDFLAQAIDIGKTGTPIEQAIAANAVLQCSSSDTSPPTDRQLRQMVNSQHESVRASLVRWLHTQYIENPTYGSEMVQKVCQLQNVPAEQSRLAESWFVAAARNKEYSREILGGLLGSLSSENRPVVRQMAKFFLERFLEEPLSQYNPIKPGPSNGAKSGVDYVTGRVRKKLDSGRR